MLEAKLIENMEEYVDKKFRVGVWRNIVQEGADNLE